MILATTTAVLVGALLLAAAAGKVRDPQPLAGTIVSLGAPKDVAVPAVFALAVTEIIVAVAVLFRPESIAAQSGIVFLALLFALAGALALRRHEPVRCHCFGAGEATLGRTQLFALVPWAATVAVLRAFSTRQTLQTGAACFAAASLLVAAASAVAVTREWILARDDRRTAQENFVWLPSY